MRFIPAGTHLTPTDDSLEVVLPDRCTLEQAAVYVDRNLVLVDSELWSKMDDTNKAALLAHEVLYFNYREFGAKDSRSTRKLVAHVFSNFEFENVNDGVPADAKLCSGMYGQSDSSGKRADPLFFRFFYYKDAEGTLVFQFRQVANFPVLSKKTFKGKILGEPLSFSIYGPSMSKYDGSDMFGVFATTEDDGTIESKLYYSNPDEDIRTGYFNFECRDQTPEDQFQN